jgi:hypothetical protein
MLCSNLLIDMIAKYIGLKCGNNHSVYNTYFFANCVLYFSIFYLLMKQNKKLIIICFALTISFSIINVLFIQGIGLLNTYSVLFSSLVVSFISYLYLKQLINEIEIDIWRQVFFWFAAATMIYCIGTLSIIGSLPYFIQCQSKIGAGLYTIHRIVYSLWYVLIATGFIIWKQKTAK